MWILYQAATLLALALTAPVLLLRRWKHYLPTLRGRFGHGQGPPARHPLWIHAVSVGEVEVARTFLRALREVSAPCPTLVTTVTPTGQERARRSLPEDVRVEYLPFELGWAQRRFLRRNQPGALVLVEGELWPLMMRRIRAQGHPVVVINGRISDRSFSRLRRARRLLGPLLGPVSHFGMQSRQDLERLLELGVASERITRTGNVKFDADPPPPLDELRSRIGELAAGRMVLVAGSTMPGEDELVLDAFEAVRGQRPLLVLAPRHPERFPEVFDLCRRRDVQVARRSALDDAVAGETEVLLLDSLGELASVYQWALGAFVGGTLVPTGGHNPIEPARCGAAVCVGPSMENFREIADAFDRARAWERIDSAADLARVWSEWLSVPDTARPVVERANDLLDRNRGAVHRSVDLVLGQLPELAGEPAGRTPAPPYGSRP